MARGAIIPNGKYVTELRIQKGFSQSELAAKAGVSRGVIQRIEKHEKTSARTLKKIADVLNVIDVQKLVANTAIAAEPFERFDSALSANGRNDFAMQLRKLQTSWEGSTGDPRFRSQIRNARRSLFRLNIDMSEFMERE